MATIAATVVRFRPRSFVSGQRVTLAWMAGQGSREMQELNVAEWMQGSVRRTGLSAFTGEAALTESQVR